MNLRLSGSRLSGSLLALFVSAALPAEAQWLQAGSGAPTNSSGVESAWYLDTATGKLYGPYTTKAWPASSYNLTTWLAALSGAVAPAGTWTFVSAVTGPSFTASSGNIVASTGNITSTTGAVSAGTTVTAGTGITATTGNVTATVGKVIAGVALSASAALPTISACGNTPPAATAGSSNNAGQFTLGTGTPTACTVTFHDAYATAAFCTVSPASAGGAAITGGYYISAQSKSAFTLTIGTGTDSLVWNYTCAGN